MHFEPNIATPCSPSTTVTWSALQSSRSRTSTPSSRSSEAIEYEHREQPRRWAEDRRVMGPGSKQTRGWDDGRQATYRMRAKETSEDYRYFPEPDLPPLHVEPAWIDGVRAALPELPAARRARYEAARASPAYDAAVLVADPTMTARLRGDLGAAGPALPAKEVANFVTGAHARVAEGRPGSTRAGTAGASTPAGIAALLGAIVDGARLAPGRARAPRAAPRGRHAGRRAARGRRARARSRTTPRCWRARRRRDRREPEGRRRPRGRQAGRPGSSSARS